MEVIVIGLFVASLSGLVISEFIHLEVLRIILKILTSILFFTYGFIRYRKNPTKKSYDKFLLSGLFFSMFGDLFMVLKPYNELFFLLGVSVFAIGHIMYVIGFTNCVKIRLSDILIALVPFLSLALLMIFGSFKFDGMFGAIMIYDAIISFMVAKAISLVKYFRNNKKMVGFETTGAILFLLSDIILLFLFFYTKHYPFLKEQLNYVIYYPAQMLIASGIQYTFQKQK